MLGSLLTQKPLKRISDDILGFYVGVAILGLIPSRVIGS